jgi:hypothetical protein
MYNRDNVRLGTESILLCTNSRCGKDDVKSMYKYSLDRDVNSGRYYFAITETGTNRIIAKSNWFTVM